MTRWGWLAILGGAAVVAASAGKRASEDEEEEEINVSHGTRKATLWAMLNQLPYDDSQRAFMMITAYGEGRFSANAHNGSASEVAASIKARDNLSDSDRAWVIKCGVFDKLGTGSWGTFQRLAPYLSLDAREIFGNVAGCSFADPTRSSLAFQIASANETAKDLQAYNGWLAYPTLGNLRLGWASPGFMGYISSHADRIAKYRKHASEVGYPESVIDEVLAPFPNDSAQIYKTLVGVA